MTLMFSITQVNVIEHAILSASGNSFHFAWVFWAQLGSGIFARGSETPQEAAKKHTNGGPSSGGAA